FYVNEDLDSLQHLAYGTQFEPYYGLLFSQGRTPNLISTLSGRAPGTSYPLNAGDQDRFKQSSKTYALLTNDSYRFTSQIEGTLGLRYTNEDKTLDSMYSNTGGAAAGCAALRARRGLVNSTLGAGTAQTFFNFGCGVYADPAFNAAATRQDLLE